MLLILMGKIRRDDQEFIPTNKVRYRLRTVLGSGVYAPIDAFRIIIDLVSDMPVVNKLCFYMLSILLIRN